MTQIYTQPGTEKWLKWAKGKLAQLGAYRKNVKLPTLKRSYKPESGVRIDLRSSRAGDYIRIFGGGAWQFFFKTTAVYTGPTVAEIAADAVLLEAFAVSRGTTGAALIALAASLSISLVALITAQGAGTRHALKVGELGKSVSAVFATNSEFTPPRFLTSIRSLNSKELLFRVGNAYRVVKTDRSEARVLNGAIDNKIVLQIDGSVGTWGARGFDGVTTEFIAGSQSFFNLPTEGATFGASDHFITSIRDNFYLIKGVSIIGDPTSTVQVYGLNEGGLVLEFAQNAEVGIGVPPTLYDVLIVRYSPVLGAITQREVYSVKNAGIIATIPTIVGTTFVGSPVSAINIVVSNALNFYVFAIEASENVPLVSPTLHRKYVGVIRCTTTVARDGSLSYSTTHNYTTFDAELGSSTQLIGAAATKTRAYVFYNATAVSLLSTLYVIRDDGVPFVVVADSVGFTPITGILPVQNTRDHVWVIGIQTESLLNAVRLYSEDGQIVTSPVFNTVPVVRRVASTATVLYCLVYISPDSGDTDTGAHLMGSDGTWVRLNDYVPAFTSDPAESHTDIYATKDTVYVLGYGTKVTGGNQIIYHITNLKHGVPEVKEYNPGGALEEAPQFPRRSGILTAQELDSW